MRHLNKGRSLSRSPSHRRALLANLAQELFQHKRIRTTLAKARELRPFAEKLVTTAKKGHIAARRHVLRFLSRKSVVKSLFEEIAPTYAERNGGYTRIIKLGPRIGDAAPMAVVELVGYEGVISEAKAAEKAKKAEKAATAKAKSKAKAKAAPKKPAGETREKPKPKQAAKKQAETHVKAPSAGKAKKAK